MLLNWLEPFSAWQQALLGTLFTWGMTALGASLVFFFKDIKRRVYDAMLGFAGGVMVAASFWSLLAPGIRMAEEMGMKAWIPAVGGFLLGGAFLLFMDQVIPHLHPSFDSEKMSEGPQSHLQRSLLLVFAITLHNLPEGMAVGVAFGAASTLSGGEYRLALATAVALALGIGIQNLPEGAAVSVPLRQEGLSRGKAFLHGQASGIVEPLGGVIGALLVSSVKAIMPWALCFAAGAMIYVVVEELIPEAQSSRNSDVASIGFMMGFAIMMLLDVALG